MLNIPIIENVYGSKKKLQWMISKINLKNKIIELGCGTGYMITLPLLKMGYDITGLDIHEDSINYGKCLFEKEKLPINQLKCCDISGIEDKVDVIIASEILEHLQDNAINDLLNKLKEYLNPGGILLVTVPNGYGWFEVENYLWDKLKINYFVERYRIHIYLEEIKELYLGLTLDSKEISSLNASPHIQKFTYSSIQNLLSKNGFFIEEIKGSVLYSGKLSNLLLRGVKPLLTLNNFLGGLFPRVSSNFYVCCRVK
ncbi:MAG: protein of unknown function, putative Methyltransferase [Gammaproteobacteria bacterium]|nr:protein of unknown function, putative Methyltransferase [Gammaproteobacteria bacterium]MBM2829562.1 protein of unknown function, putative Methyltransferase [Gammaproteobacteria bacterium]